MRRRVGWGRASVVLAAVAVVGLVLPASATPAVTPAVETAGARTSRLGGADRYETAARIALHHSGRPGTITQALRVVRGDRPLDAAASAGSGTPMLYLPPRGPIHAVVRRALTRIGPRRVDVIGSEGVIPTSRLAGMTKQAVNRRNLNTPTLSLTTSVERTYWEEQVRTADGLDVVATEPLAEASVAMANRSRNVMIVPPKGKVDVTGGPLYVMFEGRHRFVGRAAAFGAARQKEVLTGVGAQRLPGSRLAGPDRYATSAQLAREAFPRGASRVYLVGGTNGVDAAAAASLADGPLLLVPRCGVLPESTRQAIAEAHPLEVVAIGGTAAVCEGMLAQAAAAATPLPQERVSDIATSWMGPACLIVTGGEVRCSTDDDQWAPLAGQPEPMTAITVDDRETGFVRFSVVGESGRLWTWEVRWEEGSNSFAHTTPAALLPPPEPVASLATGTGATCVVGTWGGLSCLAASAEGKHVWVWVDVREPRSVSVSWSGVYAVDADGRPRAWWLDGTRAEPVVLRGVPERVVAFDARGQQKWTLTPDGTMRGHHIGGESDGRGGIVAYGVDTLVGHGCGTQGAVLRCHRQGWWFAPDGFAAPAGTTVAQVEEPWARLSDGRLYSVRRLTDAGPWTVEPVRGFER